MHELSVPAGVEPTAVSVGILYDFCFKLITLSKSNNVLGAAKYLACCKYIY